MILINLYCNNKLDDRIFACLLTSMAAVQVWDVYASFRIVGNLKGYDKEWLGSITTNRHGVAALVFATVFGCISWLSIRPMHVVRHLTTEK